MIDKRLLTALFLSALLVISDVTFAQTDDDWKSLKTWAEEQLKTVPPVSEFRQSDIPDAASLCKYAIPSSRVVTSATSDRLLRGVKRIYLYGHRNTYSELNLPFITPEVKVAQLAACILTGQLSRRGQPSRIPIFIPEREHVSMVFWPEAKNKDNLFIKIEVGLRKYWSPSEKMADDNIVMVQASYARHGFEPIEQIHMDCAQPFPYTRDQDKMLERLSYAMRVCLDRKYFDDF